MKKEEIIKTEVIEVEDVIENIDNVEEIGSGNGLKTIGVIGAIAGLSYLGYRFVIKPIRAKYKAKKEQIIKTEAVEVTDADTDVDDNANIVSFDAKKK